MNVRITRTVGFVNKKLISKAIVTLLPHEGPLVFREEQRPIMFEESPFIWSDFFAACRNYREQHNIHDDDFLVVITELANSKNWFSGFSMDGERNIFVQGTEWENYIYAEPVYPVVYDILSNIIRSLAARALGEAEDIVRFAHQDTIGCMNDYCDWKPDVTYKLRTADICPDCQNRMQRFISQDLLNQTVSVFEDIRKKMVFTSSLQKPMTFEQKLPFPVAITKRKMSIVSEPFRKLLLLIDHFDSLIRTAVLMIAALTKNEEEMEQFLADKRLAVHPSLGSWIDALAVLAKENRTRFLDLNLPKDFSTRVASVVALENDQKITAMRNEKRGHGYIECHDSGYITTFEEAINPISDIERLLTPLFYKFKYYHVISTSRIGGKRFSVFARSLSGSNPVFEEEKFEVIIENIEDIPIDGKVYLVSNNSQKWVSMDPYFEYGECPECKHNRLLIYDGIYMLDPYIGHRFKRELVPS